MTIRVLLRDYPHRAVALATDDHVLTFRHNKTDAPDSRIPSSTTANGQNAAQPQCMVDFSPTADSDLSGFRSLTSLSIHGTLGLVTISGDIFLCVVNGANRVATLRPGENVQQITSVEFRKSGTRRRVVFCPATNSKQTVSIGPITTSIWVT